MIIEYASPELALGIKTLIANEMADRLVADRVNHEDHVAVANTLLARKFGSCSVAHLLGCVQIIIRRRLLPLVVTALFGSAAIASLWATAIADASIGPEIEEIMHTNRVIMSIDTQYVKRPCLKTLQGLPQTMRA